MKQVIIFLFGFLLLQLQAFATEKLYFLMDEIAGKSYSEIISEYHGYEIHTFNIYLDKEKSVLALFSVLPSYKDKKTHWKKIAVDTIQKNILKKDSLINIYSVLFRQFYAVDNQSLSVGNLNYKNAGPLKITNGVRIIIRREDGYYVNESEGMLEFFIIKSNMNKNEYDYPSLLFPSENQTFEINIHSPVNPIYQFETNCKEMYAVFSINYPINKESNHTYYKPFMLRDRDTVLLENRQAYRFWTYGHWELHGYNFNRGVDRLTYMPDVGIVAGAYTNYFMQLFYTKTERYTQKELSELESWIQYDYLHDIQSTPLRIEVNGKVVYEK